MWRTPGLRSFVNFLAHIYLSGADDQLLIGNFIADSVRGKAFEQYPERIQQGITLHRSIDAYTDRHAVVHESKNRLRPLFGKWSAVIVDVFYDHFLAANWDEYHHEPLREYSQRVYEIIEDHHMHLPERVRGFLPFMKGGDWLYNYSKLSGIERALWGLSRRSRYNPGMDRSVAVLREQYAGFEDEFLRFFPELQAMVAEEMERVY